MAGPEDSQLAHAARIRELTQARRQDAKSSPEDKMRQLVAAEVARLVPPAVAAAVAAEFAKVQISGGQGISISGKFPNITVAINTGSGSGGSGTGARQFTATGTMNCDADPPTVTLTITG